MSQFKVTYFDFPGRAEALRLTLSIGGIPFEDDRLLPSEFAEIRSELPYNSLPILTVDDAPYTQSSALLRYLGKLTKLYPEEPYLSLCVDEIIDAVLDFISGLEAIEKTNSASYENDMMAYLEESIPRYLGGIESRVKTFGSCPWAVGLSITIADLGIYMIFLNAKAGAWDCFDVSQLDRYPRLVQIAEHVSKHPRVSEWNKSIAEKAMALKRKRKMTDPASEATLKTE